ncbi:bifunctional 4-hydroxy-2-oxoglutarate aldolase/2-dehydro-3-deoxy-phosphogluconate aldolase [Fictibacillus enclensis]|uniref:bifunctional 4-hydroxy-2-oxoglutarate aldolase/2-dehydro-3-deoxy-phosphogluconate aldolase n=1 Tax=Fictibacillus enclensis TaxID=1017270 RepID=UPI0025A1B5D6|nr:bifunctional 4-hydroxy-2-oxoglutarate aldolase/2-dehydro-3-deoxy-phosphogluconate aldolase [Fictibacillus enclensis]MDM5338484.1 bifunctional 4-hydroxy-2-oxoglutarate aldolase/2-dehydro-3-deoxy-phosphogluconate aldolase [Fictibacillus enclensis]
MLEQPKLIAILRQVKPEHVISIAEALVDEGITWMEVSLSEQEMGLACIRQLSQRFGEKIHLGVGTVLTPSQVDDAHAVGSRYIITPGWDRELVRYVKSKSLPVFPGVLTPGDVMQAAAEGITTVKLFPAAALGPDYVKSLRGPFPNLSFMAVGGITKDNLHHYKEAGCSSFAIGSELVPRGATEKDLPHIRENANVFIQQVEG